MVIAESVMGEVPDILSIVQPLTDSIRPLVINLSYLLGGIFGLYAVLIIVRIYYEKRAIRVLKDIRFDLDQLNSHYGLRTSKEQLGFFKKIIESFRRRLREKKVAKAFGKPEQSHHHKSHKS